MRTASLHAVSRARSLSILAVTVLLFGASWPVMKLGLADAAPLWFAFGRAVLMAACAASFLIATGRFATPSRHDLPLVLSIGLGQMAAFFAFSHFGLQHLPAGRGIVIAYSTPLWVIPLSWLFLREPLGPRHLAGCALGMVGLGALLLPDLAVLGTGSALFGEAWLIAAALGWAIAIVHSRHGAWRLSVLQLLPWQVGLAAICLLAAAIMIEPAGHIAPSRSSFLALLFLGVFVGPLGAWGASTVARSLPAHVSAVGFLATPLIGVALSALWLGETIGWDIGIGGGLMLAGLVLTAARRRG